MDVRTSKAIVALAALLLATEVSAGISTAVEWELDGGRVRIAQKDECLTEVKMSYMGRAFSMAELPRSFCGVDLDQARLSLGEVHVDFDREKITRELTVITPIYAPRTGNAANSLTVVAEARLTMVVSTGSDSTCAVHVVLRQKSDAEFLHDSERVIACGENLRLDRL